MFREPGGPDGWVLNPEKVTDPDMSHQKDGWKGHHQPRSFPAGYLLLKLYSSLHSFPTKRGWLVCAIPVMSGSRRTSGI